MVFDMAALIARELAFFAAAGFLVGGIDDLAVDFAWIARSVRRFFTGKGGDLRMAALTHPTEPGRFAIFVPAWREADVIGPMLHHSARQLAGQDFRLFVGCYPNDLETIAAARRVADRAANISVVICSKHGPTTKADCLNQLWRAMKAEEDASGERFKAIVLHDAEDVVDREELALFDRLVGDHALVQIPVIPLVDPGSRWVAGHYCDEFAEAHGKDMVVRDALGSGVPSAGVGCAIERDMLGDIADNRDGQPFHADSLTEDYELGLRIAERGGSGRFVRMRDEDGRLIAVRAHFPARIGPAVRQKTRWVTGIALMGWDRLGWSGGWAEHWMRMRDRRSILAATILLAAYLALVMITVLAGIAYFTSFELTPLAPAFATLLSINVGLLGWRLAMRAFFTARGYGWREGLCAVPRALMSNIIAMIAARRAITRYLFGARSEPVWDKTTHIFPERVPT